MAEDQPISATSTPTLMSWWPPPSTTFLGSSLQAKNFPISVCADPDVDFKQIYFMSIFIDLMPGGIFSIISFLLASAVIFISVLLIVIFILEFVLDNKAEIIAPAALIPLATMAIRIPSKSWASPLTAPAL